MDGTSLSGQVLGNGVMASYVYDPSAGSGQVPAGRARALGYTQPSGTQLSLYTASYDPAGNRIRVDELDGSFVYGYDATNQLILEERTSNDPYTPLYRYSYTYDPVGNRLALDDGTTITESSYNAADELLSTRPYGQPESDRIAFPSLVNAPVSRDALALELPLEPGYRYGIDAASLNLVGASGTWNAGNEWVVALQSRNASLGVTQTLATATFGQSGAGAVSFGEVGATEDAVLSVALQKVGNAPPVLGITGSLRVTAQTAGQATSFSYDAAGNTTLEAAPTGTTTFVWDTENRLTSVNAAGSVETYTYDGSTTVPGKVTGLRRTKTTAAGTTYFVWDGLNVLEELDASLARTAQYTDFPGRWGGLSSRRTSAGMSYYGFDLSANTRLVTDELAQVTAAHLYSAFGTELAGTFAQPYGFGGLARYYQVRPDRLYVAARYLRPGNGRWLTRDPIASSSGQSWYVYVANNPITRIDPRGLFQWCCCFGGFMEYPCGDEEWMKQHPPKPPQRQDLPSPPGWAGEWPVSVWDQWKAGSYGNLFPCPPSESCESYKPGYCLGCYTACVAACAAVVGDPQFASDCVDICTLRHRECLTSPPVNGRWVFPPTD